MPRGMLTVGAVAMLATLAGCSDDTPGGPSPSSPNTSAEARQLPYAGAPVVENPMPASVIQRDPCTVLTAGQIAELFDTPPAPQSDDSGIAKTCRWSDPRQGSSVNIQLVYAARDGLSQFYATKDAGDLWQPLEPVQGYPVVAYGAIDTRETTASCGVVVGIADNMVFEADVNVSDSKAGDADPCLVARRVADLAITTLKQGT
jgi:hypothetical protein